MSWDKVIEGGAQKGNCVHCGWILTFGLAQNPQPNDLFFYIYTYLFIFTIKDAELHVCWFCEKTGKDRAVNTITTLQKEDAFSLPL